tara:strand:+ start:279 stop:875 length:597 start_codon:yes stop_codon:yes gene_type:complete
MKKLYMFDLDGVLIDSKKNMNMSWDIVKLEHKVEPTFEDYFKHVGKPFKTILTEIGITENQCAIKKTYDEASLMSCELVSIYPGVVETLKKLKEDGHKIAIVTSKDIDRTKVMIKDLPKFDCVVSPKSGLRGKPAPDQLLFAMAMCNVDPLDAYYVGDMQTDKWAAERAGVKFIHVNYGYGQVKCEVSLDQIEQIILP